MAPALQLPVDATPARALGIRRFRKQVLPANRSITYNGRRLDFTRGYLRRLASNFRRLGQVPVVVADFLNRHDSSPEAYRGEVEGFELTEDGLDAIIKLTDDGARLVTSNPKLGVSARIADDCIEHVALTLAPRVAGMGPWQAADLTADSAEIIDLTAATFEVAVAPTSSSRATVSPAIVADVVRRRGVDPDQLQFVFELCGWSVGDPVDLSAGEYFDQAKWSARCALAAADLAADPPEALIDLAPELWPEIGERAAAREMAERWEAWDNRERVANPSAPDEWVL